MKKINQKGVTIIEVFVSLAIFSLVMIGLYSLFNLGIKVLGDNRARIDATALANQRLEMVRNLRYDDVGTVSGIPSGTIPQMETISINRINYSVETSIIYIDDPFDGLAGGTPEDLFNADYKRIRVEVSWPRMLNDNPVIMITDVSPKGIETDITGGTLSLIVFDAEGDPVPMADVHIENTDIDPVVNINTQTTANGKLILPGMPPAVESYDIVVTKAGYSADQTYEVDPVNNPNPNPPPITIFDGVVTETSFSIDLLGSLTINTKNLDESPLGGVDFTLRGSKTIGTDGEENPIYKYNYDLATDGAGTLTLNNMEWDSYEFIIDNPTIGYDIAGSSPALPISLLPNTDHMVDIYLSPHTENSLLVTVRSETGDLLENAEVHLYAALPPYDVTQNTTAYGQTFFSGLNNMNYSLDAALTGYDNYHMEIWVENATSIEIFMTSQ